MASLTRRTPPKSRRADTPTRHRRGPASDLERIVAMLKTDHAKVDKLLTQIETLKKAGDNARYTLVIQVCEALTVHTEIEEEIFYPAARKADQEMLVDRAEVEHAYIKDLVEDLKAMNEDDPLCDTKVQVLSEYVRHHVAEEEKILFPKLKRAKQDFTGLYARMVKRREELEQGGMAADAVARALAGTDSTRERVS